MHAFVTSKNVKWCHLIWPTLYMCNFEPYHFKVESFFESQCISQKECMIHQHLQTHNDSGLCSLLNSPITKDLN